MTTKITRRILEELLTVFVTLKVVGWIAWPWWLVLSPFLAPVAAVACLFAWVGILMAAKAVHLRRLIRKERP